MYPRVSDDLIYDVGLHNGEDAAFYLRKGFRVVGIDANPELIEHARQRFADNLRIEILNGAIERGAGTVTFYVDDTNSAWGTLDAEWAERNRHLRSSQRTIKVPVLDIRRVFEQHGIPYYLKLDIEGRERVILDAMSDLPEKPKFFSMESQKVSFRKLIADLRTLSALGYRKFKIVQQKSIPNSTIKTVDRQGQQIFLHLRTGCFWPLRR
jgi:FkbM family methyltransferase